MDWDFTENIAFRALYEAFKDSDETSALELLPPYPPYSSTFFKEMLVFYYY